MRSSFGVLSDVKFSSRTLTDVDAGKTERQQRREHDVGKVQAFSAVPVLELHAKTFDAWEVGGKVEHHALGGCIQTHRVGMFHREVVVKP